MLLSEEYVAKTYLPEKPVEPDTVEVRFRIAPDLHERLLRLKKVWGVRNETNYSLQAVMAHVLALAVEAAEDEVAPFPALDASEKDWERWTAELRKAEKKTH